MIKFSLVVVVYVLFLWGCSTHTAPHENKNKTKFNPEKYVCLKTSEPINIDGNLNEVSWENAMWTNNFVDIEGDLKPKPTYKTNAKMLWDDNYLYIAAQLEDPHVWATLKQRDTVIFYDNDFEVFIDPNSDSHEYYELEVNALGTEWDLLLTKPYRNNGKPINNWDINGLKTGINIQGTINNPADTDQGWTIELAIPWNVLKECAHKKTPPINGDQWRINFSRVQWEVVIENGKYKKAFNPETGKPKHENNWVWSPQGVIAMHRPETWGIVQFSESIVGESKIDFTETEEYKASWVLYNLFYDLKTYKQENGIFPLTIESFSPINHQFNNYVWPPEYFPTKTGYEIFWKGSNNAADLVIDNDGKLLRK